MERLFGNIRLQNFTKMLLLLALFFGVSASAFSQDMLYKVKVLGEDPKTKQYVPLKGVKIRIATNVNYTWKTNTRQTATGFVKEDYVEPKIADESPSFTTDENYPEGLYEDVTDSRGEVTIKNVPKGRFLIFDKEYYSRQYYVELTDQKEYLVKFKYDYMLMSDAKLPPPPPPPAPGIDATKVQGNWIPLPINHDRFQPDRDLFKSNTRWIMQPFARCIQDTALRLGWEDIEARKDVEITYLTPVAVDRNEFFITQLRSLDFDLTNDSLYSSPGLSVASLLDLEEDYFSQLLENVQSRTVDSVSRKEFDITAILKEHSVKNVLGCDAKQFEKLPYKVRKDNSVLVQRYFYNDFTAYLKQFVSLQKYSKYTTASDNFNTFVKSLQTLIKDQQLEGYWEQYKKLLAAGGEKESAWNNYVQDSLKTYYDKTQAGAKNDIDTLLAQFASVAKTYPIDSLQVAGVETKYSFAPHFYGLLKTHKELRNYAAYDPKLHNLEHLIETQGLRRHYDAFFDYADNFNNVNNDLFVDSSAVWRIDRGDVWFYVDDFRNNYTFYLNEGYEDYDKVTLSRTKLHTVGVPRPFIWMDYSGLAQPITDQMYLPQPPGLTPIPTSNKFNIFFTVGSSVLNRHAGKNDSLLTVLDSEIQELLSRKNIIVDTIYFEGCSSPDGNYQSNYNLARDRTASFRSYVSNAHRIGHLPGRDRDSWRVATWAEVADSMEADGRRNPALAHYIDWANQMRQVCEGIEVFDDQTKKVYGLPFYAQLKKEEYFDRFRTTAYTLVYTENKLREIDQIQKIYHDSKSIDDLHSYEVWQLYQAEPDTLQKIHIIRELLKKKGVQRPFFFKNDLQCLLLNTGQADPDLLAEYVKSSNVKLSSETSLRTPQQLFTNHVAALLSHTKISAADSVLQGGKMKLDESNAVLTNIVKILAGDRDLIENNDAVFEQIAQTSPKNRVIMHLLRNLKNGKVNDALRARDLAAKLPQDDPVSLYLLAIAAARMQTGMDVKTAEDAIKKAIKLNPQMENTARFDGDLSILPLFSEEEDRATVFMNDAEIAEYRVGQIKKSREQQKLDTLDLSLAFDDMINLNLKNEDAHLAKLKAAEKLKIDSLTREMARPHNKFEKNAIKHFKQVLKRAEKKDSVGVVKGMTVARNYVNHLIQAGDTASLSGADKYVSKFMYFVGLNKDTLAGFDVNLSIQGVKDYMEQQRLKSQQDSVQRAYLKQFGKYEENAVKRFQQLVGKAEDKDSASIVKLMGDIRKQTRQLVEKGDTAAAEVFVKKWNDALAEKKDLFDGYDVTLSLQNLQAEEPQPEKNEKDEEVKAADAPVPAEDAKKDEEVNTPAQPAEDEKSEKPQEPVKNTKKAGQKKADELIKQLENKLKAKEISTEDSVAVVALLEQAKADVTSLAADGNHVAALAYVERFKKFADKKKKQLERFPVDAVVEGMNQLLNLPKEDEKENNN